MEDLELGQLDLFCHEVHENAELEIKGQGFTFDDFEKTSAFEKVVSTTEGRSVLAKHFPGDFALYWKEKLVDERCMVCLFAKEEETDCCFSFSKSTCNELITAARGVGLFAEITGLLTSTAFLELKNVHTGKGKATNKSKVKLVCDNGKRTMIWCRSATDADIMMEKAHKRIKSHLLQTAVQLYEKDNHHGVDITKDIQTKHGTVRIEFQSTPIELNPDESSQPEESHGRQREDSLVDTFYQSLFSLVNESHDKSDSRCEYFQSHKSMKVASLVQNYHSVAALSHFNDSKHPYGAFEEKKSRVAIEVSKAPSDGLVTAKEQNILESSVEWIMTADRLLRSFFISENKTCEKNDRSKDEEFESKSIRVASLVQNYRCVTALSHFYGTNHPYGPAEENKPKVSNDVSEPSSEWLVEETKEKNLLKWSFSTNLFSCALEVTLEPMYEAEPNQESRLVDECKLETTCETVVIDNEGLITAVQQRETTAVRYEDGFIEDRDGLENEISCSDMKINTSGVVTRQKLDRCDDPSLVCIEESLECEQDKIIGSTRHGERNHIRKTRTKGRKERNRDTENGEEGPDCNVAHTGADGIIKEG